MPARALAVLGAMGDHLRAMVGRGAAVGRRDDAFGRRFRRLQLLGQGAFGAVYAAIDEERGARVALKILRSVSPDALRRFKREFRVLHRVRHPNVVRLYELFEEGGEWAFSMEWVEGDDLLSWIRTDRAPLGFDEARLRDALGQLGAALSAVHACGLLHRDVKPENVRVGRGGRVVLLDFGLVRDEIGPDHSVGLSVVGTPAYMAPELATGETAGPASDYYGLGATLYHCLTGKLPFDGDLWPMLMAKATKPVLAPSQLVPGLAEDLDALCVSLLERKPELRAGADEVRAISRRVARHEGTSGPSTDVFVGRTRSLAALSAWHERRASGPTLCVVRGESGIGKTALVRRFLEQSKRDAPELVMLQGRCYEHEAVPYNAFDAMMDSLSVVLSSGRSDGVGRRADGWTLARLFPVLARVPGLAAARGDLGSSDEATLRLQAFEALRGLLNDLARQTPLILFVDDVHWADDESLRLLSVLVEPGKAAFQVIVTTRLGETVGGELCRDVLNSAGATTLTLEGLSEGEVTTLFASLHGLKHEGHALTMASTDTGGHPLLVQELARLGAMRHDPASPARLDVLLSERVRLLSKTAQTVLSLVCTVGKPVSERVLKSAIGDTSEDLGEVIEELESEHFARRAPRGRVECAHDRLREVIVTVRSAEESLSLHETLASAMIAAGNAEPGDVAHHYRKAGKLAAAVPFLIAAGEEAMNALAFDRAASCFEQALAPADDAPDAETLQRVRVLLGEAYQGAGRSAQAAAAFARAAVGAHPVKRVRLELASAQHSLQAARILEGMGRVKRACELARIPGPSSVLPMLLRLLYHRVIVTLRGLEPRRREASAASPMQLELSWALALPLMWVDVLASAEMTARHLRLALRADSAPHLCRALAHEAFFQAMQAPVDERTPENLLARATTLAGADPELVAWLDLMRGSTALVRWRVNEAESLLRAAEAGYAAHGTRANWLLSNVRAFLGISLVNQGKYQELAEAVPRWDAEAAARGDQFAQVATWVSGYGFMVHLARDQPTVAMSLLDRLAAVWQDGSPQSSPAFNAGIGRIWIALYVGGGRALAFLASAEGRAVSKSFMVRNRFGRTLWLWLQGLSEVEASCRLGDGARRRSATKAEGRARQLAGLGSPFAHAAALGLRAQAAMLQHDRTTARSLASAARDQFAAFNYVAQHAYARMAARLDDRDDDESLRAWIAREKLADSDRLLAISAPTLALL